MAAVDHDADARSRSRHANGLSDRARGVGRVMHHPPGVDDVELVVGERQRLGVGDAQIRVQPLELQPAAGELDAVLGEVDPRQLRARAGEANVIGAEADADLEHALVARGRE
jgi:hypothetical protein